MKKQLIRYAGIASAITMGLSGIASAHSIVIDTTGPFSHNAVSINEWSSGSSVSSDNDNVVRIINHNWQWAVSGDALVKLNTIGGNASTGDAWNDNSTNTHVDISNDGLGWGCGGGCFGGGGHNGDITIGVTGPYSHNTVNTGSSSSFHQSNNNDVNVTNHNWQKAVSGDATVKLNTIGGDASTGDASNTNDTSTDVNISNSGSGGCGCLGSGGGGSVTIDTTGPYSVNTVSVNHGHGTNVSVSNNNDVTVNNTNHQTAVTGDATVSTNTIGGDASTGDASNSNDTSTNVSISNG